jgi:ABC-type polysaccharide/polyol phosphate export permease
MNAVALTIFDQLKLLYFLVERELKGRYSRSPIGVLSAIAEPMAILLILTVVFS